MSSSPLTVKIPPLTKKQLIMYGKASTDLNPIHIDEEKAREFGLPSVIAHGMLTMAFMGRLFGRKIECGWFVQNFHARFHAKVFVGDQLTVIAKKEHTSEKIEQYSIRVINQDESVVASGYIILTQR